jgi:DNA-binding NarL/FixJ family response regulator
MEFIFMLTHNDSTVENAREVLDSVVATGLTHIGFKDVGATAEKQRELAQAAKAAGMTVYLEIVSVDKSDELASVDAAISAGVDWIVGGKFAEEATERLVGTGIKFAPFPGRVVGHPSELEGTIEEIAAHASQLVAMDGVHGVDLLAYRHKGVDPLELTKAVATAIGDRPLIAAGSVVKQQQIQGLAEAGAWGFTIGGAIFDGMLPGEKDVVSQVTTALEFAREATNWAG